MYAWNLLTGRENARRDRAAADALPRGVAQITTRILVSGNPTTAADNGGPNRGCDANDLAQYMRRKHGGRYMLWNVESAMCGWYDPVLFDNQVGCPPCGGGAVPWCDVI